MKITIICADDYADVALLEIMMRAVVAQLPNKPTIMTRDGDKVAQDFAWRAGLSYAVCRNTTAVSMAGKAKNLFAFGTDVEIDRIIKEARKLGHRVRVYVDAKGKNHGR